MPETIREKLIKRGRFDGKNKQAKFFEIKNIKSIPDGMTIEEDIQYWKETLNA